MNVFMYEIKLVDTDINTTSVTVSLYVINTLAGYLLICFMSYVKVHIIIC